MLNIMSYLSRAKYGFSLTAEAVKFSILNFDVSILYLFGLVIASIPAVLTSIGLYWFLTLIGFNSPDLVMSVGVAIYVFTFFYVRSTIVYIIGSRMLGEKISVLKGIRSVLNNLHLYNKWAVIILLVTFVLDYADRKNNGSFLSYFTSIGTLVWKATTYFILPTLTFFSSDDIREEAAQSVFVLRKRYIEISAAKIASAIIMRIMLVLLVLFAISTVVLGLFGTINLANLEYTTLGGGSFFLTILTFIVIIFGGYMLIWLFITYLQDVVRVALYLESEAPKEEINGFDTSLFDAEIPNEEKVQKDFIPEEVEEYLQKQTRNGEFKVRI